MKIREYTHYNENEIFQLYKEVGWMAYTDDMSSLEKGFTNALLTLAAYEDEELLGIIKL